MFLRVILKKELDYLLSQISIDRIIGIESKLF